MERFCDRCGGLVEGDGAFCPFCGGMMGPILTENQNIDLTKSEPNPNIVIPTPYTGSNDYQNGQQNTIYAPVSNQNQDMTVGQWILTIFLSNLGFIGLVLLFIWAFSSTTPTVKKNFARGMLIWQAIISVFAFLSWLFVFGFIYSIVEGISSDMMYSAASILI